MNTQRGRIKGMDFNGIIDRYSDLVYKIAFLYTGTASDSDDIFQETFLKLASRKGEFKDEEHLKAWLIRVTVNFCKMHHRSAYSRHKAELDENIPVQASDDALVRQAVTGAVMKLPEKYRVPVLLFYYYGYSCEETARLMKITNASVRTRLKRARELLKTELEEVWNDE